MPDARYDVVIIGAGWSGLDACRGCIAGGLRTVVLEASGPRWVWAYADETQCRGEQCRAGTEGARSSPSRCLTQISDFPVAADAPDPSAAEDGCRQFALKDHIRFHQSVCRIAKESELWEVQTADGRRWSAERVIVTSGIEQDPEFAGADLRIAGSGRGTWAALRSRGCGPGCRASVEGASRTQEYERGNRTGT